MWWIGHKSNEFVLGQAQHVNGRKMMTDQGVVILNAPKHSTWEVPDTPRRHWYINIPTEMLQKRQNKQTTDYKQTIQRPHLDSYTPIIEKQKEPLTVQDQHRDPFESDSKMEKSANSQHRNLFLAAVHEALEFLFVFTSQFIITTYKSA